MAENTPEVFEAKRKSIAILGPISGDRELHEQAKQEGSSNPHGQGAQGKPGNPGSANER